MVARGDGARAVDPHDDANPLQLLIRRRCHARSWLFQARLFAGHLVSLVLRVRGIGCDDASVLLIFLGHQLELGLQQVLVHLLLVLDDLKRRKEKSGISQSSSTWHLGS